MPRQRCLDDYSTRFSTADRIAIISNGSLICCGSFEFLKHRFGRGHQLALVTNARTNRKSSTASRTFTVQADVEETDHASSFGHTPIPSLSVEDGVESVTRFIQEFVGSCQLEEVRGRELRYLLPLHQARPSVLARLFKQLDIDKERLGITSYGLTACSMEEVSVCVCGCVCVCVEREGVMCACLLHGDVSVYVFDI